MMRKFYLIGFLCLSALYSLNAQTLRVAIIDFENTSGIPKYDGLGKAMSSMLISDITSNVSPRRLQLIERSQIQKILKEQNFQASSAVDKSSIVKAGKILGVKYLLLGDIYILNDALVINARFVDAETGDIKFSKKQEGKLPAWLSLKTNIAKELATSISMPFTEPAIQDKETPLATLTTFGNAIAANDAGDTTKALTLLNTVVEFDPDFKYIEDLKNEIENLKKRMDKVEVDLEITTTDPITAAKNYAELGNIKEAEKYYLIGIKRLSKIELGKYILYNHMLAELFFNNKDFNKTISYCNNILDIYPYYNQAVYLKAQSLLNTNNEMQFLKFSQSYLANVNKAGSFWIFEEYLGNYINKNKIPIEGKKVDIITKNEVTWFQMNINGYQINQAPENIFGSLLSEFCQVNSKIFSVDSTVRFLKRINAINPSMSTSDLTRSIPYYIPKLSYVSAIAELKDNLLLLETGEEYTGPFYKQYDGTIWTKPGPELCPCKRLATADEFAKMNSLSFNNPWKRDAFQAEGWYSMLKKDVKNARNKFIECIIYDTRRIWQYEGFLPKKQKMDSLLYNLNSQKPMELFGNIVKSEVYINTDDLVNNIINYAHSYTIEGKISNAKEIYLLFDINYELKNYKMRIKDIVLNDLKDFFAQKLISQRTFDELLISFQ